jgi:hypothetical protein
MYSYALDKCRPYQEANKRFRALGCAAWDDDDDPAPCSNPPLYSAAQLEGLKIVQEALGDDLDAYAGDGRMALSFMEGADDE